MNETWIDVNVLKQSAWWFYEAEQSDKCKDLLSFASCAYIRVISL